MDDNITIGSLKKILNILTATLIVISFQVLLGLIHSVDYN